MKDRQRQQVEEIKRQEQKELIKKMVKKSKNSLIEVPAYFSQEELLSQFNQRNDQ